MRIFRLVFLLILTATTISAQSLQREFEKGTRAANRGDFARALRYFQTARETAGSADSDLTARIHYNLGVCFFHLNQFADAIAQYERAIALSGGKYQKAFYALGAAHNKSKNRLAAKTAFETAARLGNAEAWFDLGLIAVEEKDFAAAANAFKKAIENDSIAAPAAHNNLGVIAAINNDLRAAEKEFETALKRSNNDFAEAAGNLEICRSRRLNRDWTALFEFSQKRKEAIL